MNAESPPFKITSKTRHYVNSRGDQCEVFRPMSLRGGWAVFWLDGAVTFNDTSGRCYHISFAPSRRSPKQAKRSYHHITSAYEGWLACPTTLLEHTPIRYWPKRWKYASIFYCGERDSLAVRFHSEKPTASLQEHAYVSEKDTSVYFNNAVMGRAYALPSDVHALTEGFNWQDSLIEFGHFKRDKVSGSSDVQS